MPSPSKVVRAFIDSYAEIRPDEARMRLHELFMEVARLEEENQELREEVNDLRIQLQRRKNLEYHDCGFYIIGDSGTQTGPVCPECYEAKGFSYILRSARGGARCTVCGNEYAGARGLDDGTPAPMVV